MPDDNKQTEYCITFNFQGWLRQWVTLDKPITKEELLTKLKNYEWLVSLEEEGYVVDITTDKSVGTYSNTDGETEIDMFEVEEID